MQWNDSGKLVDAQTKRKLTVDFVYKATVTITNVWVRMQSEARTVKIEWASRYTHTHTHKPCNAESDIYVCDVYIYYSKHSIVNDCMRRVQPTLRHLAKTVPASRRRVCACGGSINASRMDGWMRSRAICATQRQATAAAASMSVAMATGVLRTQHEQRTAARTYDNFDQIASQRNVAAHHAQWHWTTYIYAMYICRLVGWSVNWHRWLASFASLASHNVCCWMVGSARGVRQCCSAVSRG